MNPLFAHDSSELELLPGENDALLCAFAISAPQLVSGRWMYMPGGRHIITPSQSGKAVQVEVLVGPDSAAALNAQLADINQRGRKRAYFDFDHGDGKASFWPERFEWSTTPEPGIYAIGEETASGRAAIEGKDYRGFSPVFFVNDVKAKPARIVCREGAKPNMGGLVNNPAFSAIKPFFAQDATHSSGSAAGDNQNKTDSNMNEQELAALRAKNQGLQNEIDALKAKNADDAAISAKQSELRAIQAEISAEETRRENEALKAKNKQLESDATARAEADADAAVNAAVARGAIAAKDEGAKKQWKALICANAGAAALLAAVPSSPALGGRITAPANTEQRVERGQMGGRDALQAYSALVARNAAIPDVRSPEKSKLAKEMGAIFAAEMKGREDHWMNCPLDEAIQAADVTNAAVGTLAGTLVLQRNLPLLTFNYPMLKTFFTDFSDSTGLWLQTEMTRIQITPAVTEYDGTLDSNGRPLGFVVVTPAQTVDVPITLSKHVGIPMIFGVQTLASTVRNLFAEQSAGAINALGGYFVNMATALMTSANFNAFAGITIGTGATTSGSTAITMASNAIMYPGQPISGTGIPTGARIASVTSATAAVLTIAATATNTGLTFTLGGGLVPSLFTTYVKALADFNFASLGEIGAAFDNIRVPYEGRFAMLNASYYQKLAQDPTFNTFFAATRNREIISKGLLPELNNFTPQKAPWFPTSSNRVGFAYHAAAIALKSRLPQDFMGAVGAAAPGTVTTISDPDTGISVLNVQRIDLVGSYAESRIEVMLGANAGDRRAGLVITSA